MTVVGKLVLMKAFRKIVMGTFGYKSCISDIILLKHGVPQGSLLEPIPLIFINDLTKCVTYNSLESILRN